MDVTEATVTAAVESAVAGAPDPRTAEVLTAVVRHAHALVRELEPTQEEWAAAVGFLTAVGQASDDRRQEMIMLSDVLGISMLVEAVNARLAGGGPGATPATVLGPFHVSDSPVRDLGDSIDLIGDQPVCVVTGRVTDVEGRPVAGANVDVWQADAGGAYDVQLGDPQLAGNGRGMFATDGDGAFWFRTVVPAPYQVPTDGPVGVLLRAADRHAWRPAHVHFQVDAPGYVALTTHAFVAGSPYLDSDAVFAVQPGLVHDVRTVDDPVAAARWGVATPFRLLEVDLVLGPCRAERPEAAHGGELAPPP